MTVSSTTNRKSFTGDGVTTSFGTSPVVFFNSSELVVQVIVTATGAATTLVENTNYTVSGGSGSTGTVNLASGTSPNGAPSASQTLLIRRVLPLTQTDDFVNNDINDAEVTEDRFDKTVMQIQQLGEELGRGLVIPPAETATDALTVLPFDRASQYLAFDASKNLIASPGPAGDNVPVSTFMATVLDDTTATDARTTLGFTGAGGTAATANIEDSAVTAAKLATDAVETAKIKDGNVTLAKLAAAAFASQAEAEAGTENTKLTTSLRVAQAVKAQGKSILVLDTGSTGISAGVTVYLGNSYADAVEAGTDYVVPFACTVRNMRTMAGAGQTGGQSTTFTLRKNSADTSLTCANTSGRTASDTTNSVTFAAGDTLSVKAVTSASATVTNHRVMVEVRPV